MKTKEEFDDDYLELESTDDRYKKISLAKSFHCLEN